METTLVERQLSILLFGKGLYDAVGWWDQLSPRRLWPRVQWV